MSQENTNRVHPDQEPETPSTPEVVVSHISGDRYVLLGEENTDAWIKTDNIVTPPR